MAGTTAIGQERSKMLQVGLETAQEAPKAPQGGSKEAPQEITKCGTEGFQ